MPAEALAVAKHILQALGSQVRELIKRKGAWWRWGSAKNCVTFPIASLRGPKMVALVRSEHFYDSIKVNRINVLGTTPENIAFNNVCFQASRHETAP